MEGKEEGRDLDIERKIKLNLERLSFRCMKLLHERIEVRKRLSLSRVEGKKERGKKEKI